MTRKLKINGREVTVFKMDLPDTTVKTKGRAKTFERLLVESLKVGEATDLIPYSKIVSNATQKARTTTGRVYAIRKDGKACRVFCTGRAKNNVLQLRREQIAA